MRYLQAAKYGGHQSTINRIVIHATVSPCVEGGAISVARYFQSSAAGGSAHYVVDPHESVSCLHENVVAWHAPPNTGSIGVELCDLQKGSPARWHDELHEAMLRRAAALVRQIAERRSVPVHRLSVADLRAGKSGICGHVDVSKAFGQTDHVDPGDAFPWSHFMDLVRGGASPTASWTELLVKDLPTLGTGDDSFDVKTVRAALFARGELDEAVYGGDAGLKAWLELTAFDADLAKAVSAYQRAEGLDDDGVVGPKTWPPLLRIA